MQAWNLKGQWGVLEVSAQDGEYDLIPGRVFYEYTNSRRGVRLEVAGRDDEWPRVVLHFSLYEVHGFSPLKAKHLGPLIEAYFAIPFDRSEYRKFAWDFVTKLLNREEHIAQMRIRRGLATVRIVVGAWDETGNPIQARDEPQFFLD